ncbi:aspartyl-tRNA(Asn)/glutamyl-tRNA (Gln) amidotransferase subunit C [Deferribacter desulfuricans SSM1]|uniref:Aspartyl/glutamyl-tRNA(Asn/Gln) amidotransferase subunit C n=1 Tax=Deferribacter desulfuricans (strain DSM 14783 / JCM 11476 / NBRC 101012 / SSM1) TaxID=639282 RepID=D3P9L1_DEFDS|nr:Asp-tRNA(Asn)/Glu-tRNA(Gln) amidotransferase subunit GatC [Deferribacter desulfuricans]BAI81401.1 aspartyl-tRNA(Asn)/glutamyl-tRNA (Gln) amidotransferase subunit C [Deferribacter desulfuricans SSM1]
MSEIISKKDVKHIAKLARLTFNDEEIEKFTGELNKILDYIHKLNELNTDDVEPTSHVLDITNVFRDDSVKESLANEEALKNAPEKEYEHFKVPRVIEG